MRVTDAEGERSVLARELRRPKADPATASAETWRNHRPAHRAISEKDLAHSERLSGSRGSAGDSGSQWSGAIRRLRKVVWPDVLADSLGAFVSDGLGVVGRVLAGKPAILAVAP